MRKTTLLKGSFLIATLWAFGCANTETDVSRRGLDDTIDINGAGYASKEISEGNVFGKESEGLVENPLNKPSDDVLGKAGAYENLVYTVEPTEAKAYINEFIEFEVVIDTSGEDFKQNNSPDPRFVVVLERPADGNATLIVDKSELFNKSEFPPTDTMAVLKPDSKNTMRFKVLTGSAYNQDDPMYWVNVWSADADMPAIAKINVKKPPQKSDYEKGNSDVSNTLETSDAMEENLGKSKLTSVNLVSDEAREQTILVDTEKTFTVKLDDAKCNAGETGGEDCEVKGEPICWTFVEHVDPNDGDILSPAPDDDLKLKDKDGVQVGCGEADDKGEVQVKIETGGSYDARYYLNFFHAKAAPLTFQIDTYAMPDTLGEPGDGPTDDLDGDGKPDNNRDITPENGFTTDPVTGKEQLTGCTAANVLDQLWTDDAIKNSILEQCSNPKLESMSSCSGGDCDSDDGNFKCRLTKEADGTLMLSTCDGDVVMVDLDGDGIADPVRVVVTDNGDGSYRIDGFDTDGDGKPDIAPDPCMNGAPCGGSNYKFQCQVLKDGAKPDDNYKACTKVSAGLDEDLDIYLKLDGAGSGETLEAKIIRGALASNNADFKDYGEDDYKQKEITEEDGSKKLEPIPTLTLTTGSEGKTKAVFWTGTAYDALYYIRLMNDDAKTVMLPVNVINSVDIPTFPGDKPDEDALKKPDGEAVTPPSDMPDYVPDLGPLVMEVAPGLSTDISSPVIRTLGLKVVLKTDYEKTGKSNLIQHEKVWWKVTRGPSSANNGSLLHSKSETDTKGTAVNYFYTGTGYDALYYVSVFHPNVLDEDGNVDPVIFAITTTNNTGTVPGPEPGDPSLPEGETKCPDGYTSKLMCGKKVVKEDETECSDGTKPKYKCVDEGCKDENCEGIDPTTVNGIDVNPNLPQMTCEEYVAMKCADNPSKEECAKGCLELKIVGNSYKRFQPGKIEKTQFRLVHKMGETDTDNDKQIVWEETVIPNENIHYTIDKNPEANAALLGKKSQTDEDGKATASFKTGSKITTFKINAMHPNINDGKNMLPVTVNISVYDPSQEPSDITHWSKIHLNVEDPSNITLYPGDKLEKVYYYVIPSDKAQCGESFVYNDEAERTAGCIELGGDEKLCGVDATVTEKQEEGGKREVEKESVEVSDDRSSYTVYAVGTDIEGKPVTSGCVSYQSFPSWTKPKDCVVDKNDIDLEKDEDESNEEYQARVEAEYQKKLNDLKNQELCTRTMTVTVPMTKMPMVIDSTYHTKTLVNIGPLLNEKSGVGKEIKDFVDKINIFLGKHPEDDLTKKLTQYFIYDKEENGQSEGSKGCVDALQRIGKCEHANGDSTNELKSICNSHWNGTQYFDTAMKKEEKDYFEACDCICADLVYWTALDSIGSKIAGLAKKGIKSLLKKYIGRDGLTDMLCGVIDDLQYITLSGTLKLEKNGTTYKGGGEYTGLEIPYINDKVDLGGKVVGGTWQQAIVSDAGNQIAISKYNLSLTYGEFIYDILGKAIGMENGKIDLLDSLCDKLPSINLIVIDLSSEMLGGLCKTGVTALGYKAFEFAASKYVNLNVTLDGTATFERGKTKSAENGGYYAQLITGGQWEGTGALGEDKAEGKSADDTINGLWVGAREINDMPEFEYGNKTVDDFKAENSICRQWMSEAAVEEAIKDGTFNSNKACLGGTYELGARLNNHKCKEEACQKKSIVVCNGDKLNSEFVNATAATIIKAANRACSNDQNQNNKPDDCAENPEIIKGGSGVTNVDCLEENECKKTYCNDNPSIFVCGDNEKLENADLELACGELQVGTECYKVKAQEGCAGNCDAPGCIMNSEVVTCKATPDLDDASGTLVDPELLAKWTFSDKDSIQANSVINPDGSGDGFNFKFFNGGCSYKNENADNKEKYVAGADSALGAFGTAAFSETASNDNCKFELTIPSVNTYSQIKFKVMGADREISYKYGGISGKVDGSGSEWKTVNIDIPLDSDVGTLNIYMTPSVKNYQPDKMMRLDDIEVWGKKGAGTSGNTSSSDSGDSSESDQGEEEPTT